MHASAHVLWHKLLISYYIVEFKVVTCHMLLLSQHPSCAQKTSLHIVLLISSSVYLSYTTSVMLCYILHGLLYQYLKLYWYTMFRYKVIKVKSTRVVKFYVQTAKPFSHAQSQFMLKVIELIFLDRRSLHMQLFVCLCGNFDIQSCTYGTALMQHHTQTLLPCSRQIKYEQG